MVGIDIVDLSRISLNEHFVKRILTEEEYKEYAMRKTEKRKIEYLGGRFACKEAIFKATEDPKFLSYSILNSSNGKPYIKGHPEMHISISHDGGLAIAIVQNDCRI